LFIQRDAVSIVELADVMRRVGEVISARPIKRAPHISANSDPQSWPLIPLEEGIVADWNNRWFVRVTLGGAATVAGLDESQRDQHRATEQAPCEIHTATMRRRVCGRQALIAQHDALSARGLRPR
jgi:hypothetical protein